MLDHSLEAKKSLELKKERYRTVHFTISNLTSLPAYDSESSNTTATNFTFVVEFLEKTFNNHLIL
jgi:hypothetical protein